jgi:phosphopantothenoylcysteine synthetase/decarboxylase
MKILVTAGGTRESIDGVRFISNFSTGRTAAHLADDWLRKGDEVVYLHGVGSVIPQSNCKKLQFTDYKSLENNLKSLCAEENWSAIVHTAAVSDYSISFIEAGGQRFRPSESGKISSDSENLALHLTKNVKLLDQIKSFSKAASPLVIGFKLTNTPDLSNREKSILKISNNAEVNFVVHNDLTEISQTGESHRAQIWKGSEMIMKTETKTELARKLRELMRDNL